jgi:hypothetical protein
MAWRMHGIFESWLKDLVRSELWDTWKVIPKPPKPWPCFRIAGSAQAVFSNRRHARQNTIEKMVSPEAR